MMAASTSLSISLNASDRPIATETPAVTPNDAASEAAPATAWISEASSARSAALCARMPSVRTSLPSPSMVACTTVRILFSAYEPAALIPRPTLDPPPTPTAAAITTESISWVDTASIVNAPTASIDESITRART